MKSKFFIVLSSLLLVQVSSANLLLNPSFEAGTGVDADNWTEFGNVSREVWADKNGLNLSDDGLDVTEDYGIALQGWIDGGSGGFFQDVAATSGVTYTLDADFHFEPNFDATTFELKLEWLDAGSALISDNVLNLIPFSTSADPTVEGNWTNFKLTHTAPVGTVFARSTLFFSGTSDIGGGQAGRVDNFSLVVVPEAQTLSMITL